ncbi:hypothetical protein HJFPF1_13246 [Paramyrothecium foliicola]|nr:hypothetical protein HJFPF1_13246 [Paramyrothecium foliicola]
MRLNIRSSTYLRGLQLRLRFLGTYIFDNPPQYLHIETMSMLSPNISEYIFLVETALRSAKQQLTNSAHLISVESELAWNLLLAALYCRDSTLRESATALLRVYPGQDGLWNTQSLYVLAKRSQWLETVNALEGRHKSSGNDFGTGNTVEYGDYMLFITKAAAALAALQFYLVPAQVVIDTTNDDRRENLPPYVFEEAFSKTNATSGTQDVLGYNLTTEYPGSQTAGWKLSLSISGNIAVSTSRYLTAARIQYSPPAQLSNVSTHKSWGSCIWYGYVEYDETAKVNDGCRGVLSDECYTALNKAVEAGDVCYSESTVPRACEGELSGDDNFLAVGVRNYAGSSTDILGPKLHEPDNFEYYDTMIKRDHCKEGVVDIEIENRVGRSYATPGDENSDSRTI